MRRLSDQRDDEDEDRPDQWHVGEDSPEAVQPVGQGFDQLGERDRIARLRLRHDGHDQESEQRQNEQDDVGRPAGPWLNLGVREQADAACDQLYPVCVSGHVSSFPLPPLEIVDVAWTSAAQGHGRMRRSRRLSAWECG